MGWSMGTKSVIAVLTAGPTAGVTMASIRTALANVVVAEHPVSVTDALRVETAS